MNMMLVVFVAFLLIVAGMAIGVIMGRKPISGSCGGMAAAGMEGACDICKGDRDRCDKEKEKAKAVKTKTEFYDATKR